MREIKFRGLSDEGNWAYGMYVDGYIINGVMEATDEYIAIENWCPVDIETAGQYTGIKDVKGIEIYEDDIVKHRVGKGKVYYDEAETSYILEPISGADEYLVLGLEWDLEVIGNIHDNPEFLEKR